MDIAPERFRTELGENSIIKDNPRIQSLLNDPEKVEFFRQLTLMGDPLADALAARIPELGYKKVRAMLDQAASEGAALALNYAASLRVLKAVTQQLAKEGEAEYKTNEKHYNA